MDPRKYEIIGAPFDRASKYSGSSQAPQTIREKKLFSWLKDLQEDGLEISDGGDVPMRPLPDPESKPDQLEEILIYSDPLMKRLKQSYTAGNIPVILGGDHSISIASISTAVERLKSKHGDDAELGVIWVDAHPDLETPEDCIAGDLHATTVAHLLGYGDERLANLCGFSPKLKPQNIAIIGLRDVVPSERKILKEHNMEVYTMFDIERLSIVEICERAFSRLERETSGLVISFDIDACDPLVAPGVEYPERGGLNFREACMIMQ